MSNKKTPAKMGRPLLGKQAKQRYTVMIEPNVAAMLRQLGGKNLSRGIAIAASWQPLLQKRAKS